MKKILLITNFLLVGFTYAQSGLDTAENYVYEKNCLTEDCSRKTESVQYFDGLGRAKQSIAIKATPAGKDIAVPSVTYDMYGRPIKNYLPVPQSGTQNGALYGDPLSNASAIYGNEKIYTEKVLESSPLGRTQEQRSVGNDWSAHPVKFSYDLNTSADAVKKYTVTSSSWTEGRTNGVLNLSGTYPENTLYKSAVTDEDGNIATGFKNKKGQTILTRKKDGTQNVDTYYVYNEYGKLAYTIPPLASQSGSVDDTTLNNLCYQYRYDGWNRLVEKKIPGKGWEYMLYDKQDRLVGSQDSALKAKGQWLYVKYDEFGRAAITGIGTGYQRSVEQAEIDALGANNVNRVSTAPFNRQGVDVYYGNQDITYPNSTKSVTLLSLNYYDTYPAYSFNPSLTSPILGKTPITDNSTGNNVSTKSLPVMGLVKNIEDDNWTKNYIFYDDKARTIGSYSINHLGGYTKTESELDFIGVPQRTRLYQVRKANELGVTINQRFVYDSGNRLLQHYHQVDSKPEQLLSENTYNELSQIINKKVGNNLQSIDYTYNIRGVMTDVNKDQMSLADLGGKLFSYKIKYNQKEGVTNPDAALFSGKDVKPKYNGSISEIDWRAVETVGVNPSITPKRYGYAYDDLNRITAGYYQNPNNPYSKENTESLSYDLNGNITNLYRTSVNEYGSNTATVIDKLNYSYIGNRATNINDISQNFAGYEGGGNTISYDVNGNMTNMPDKGISSINYNFLNLQNSLTLSRNGNENIIINTKYRADGTRLRKENTTTISGFNGDTTTVNFTDYLDGFQYFHSGTLTPIGIGFEMLSKRAMQPQTFSLDRPIGPVDPTIDPPFGGGGIIVDVKTPDLQYFPTSEGFYDYIKDQYIYQYKDQLGNVRVSYARNSAGALEITDNNDYYPFGMNHLKTGTAFFGQGSYKNQKYNGKELQETGMYSYGWREYMPDIGRWNGIDQLAENYLSTSTYAYVANNPVSYADVDGRWFNQDGTIDTSGRTPYFVNGKQMQNSFLGINPGEGGGGGGSYTPFGQTGAYNDLMAALQNGEDFGLTNQNGYMTWWTDGNKQGYGTIINGEIEIGAQEMIIHKMKLYERDKFWDGVSKKLGVFGFANDVKIQLFEAGIRRSAGLTINEFNALNTTAQELRTLSALGYTGSKYLSGFKMLGVAASIVTTSYSASKVYNQYEEGGAGEVFSHRDVLDTTVGLVGLGTTALVTIGLVSNPVGWAIGIGVLAYGTGTMIYDLTQEP